MWKKTLILTIVCLFALALVSIAEDRVPVKEELHRRFEHNRDVLIDRGEQKALQKFQEIRKRIEKLRSMAREAEEKAKHFWAEAEELEQTLKREFERRKTAGRMEKIHAQLAELKEGAELRKKAERLMAKAREIKGALKRELEHREMAGRMEKMHAELAELKEAIEHAKREGRHDKADELHEKAWRMAVEIKAHQREAGEKKFHKAEKRVVQLQEWTRQAKERGQMDKAERLWAEAKELKGTLKRELEHREMAGRMEKMHAGLAELKEAAEHAKREGQHDKAAELRKKAGRMADEIKAHVKEAAKTALREKGHAIKNEIERLHAMAGKAKEAGDHEKAKAILGKAKNLQRQLRDVAEREKEKAHKNDLENLVEKLRNEVKSLRQEVERLKQSR